MGFSLDSFSISRFTVIRQYYQPESVHHLFQGLIFVESKIALKATPSSTHVSTSIMYILSLSILLTTTTLPTYQAHTHAFYHQSPVTCLAHNSALAALRAVAALHQIWCLWGRPKAAQIFLESILSRSTICARGEDGGRGARSPSADLD